MTKKEELQFEEKFFVLNRKRIEELNDAVYSKYTFPPLVDCEPANDLQTALKKFAKEYEEWTGKKLDQKYYVCNQDEPYAETVLKIILSNGSWIENEIRQAKPQWIDVKERLPEIDKRVIIFNKDLADRNDEDSGNGIDLGYLRKSGRFMMEGSPSDWNITHWVPLPKPLCISELEKEGK